MTSKTEMHEHEAKHEPKHEAKSEHEAKHEAATATKSKASQFGGPLPFEPPPVPPEGAPEGPMALGTIQASATNADGATTTTAASAFLGGGDVVTATVTNGATPPTQACQVILLLSADAVTYYRVDSKWAGFAPSGVYPVAFNMADYADVFSNFGLLLPWLWYKIQFKGNIGAAVTVAATNSGT
jgi:hypothetical protein